jgi:hypothetical protein
MTTLVSSSLVAGQSGREAELVVGEESGSWASVYTPKALAALAQPAIVGVVRRIASAAQPAATRAAAAVDQTAAGTRVPASLRDAPGKGRQSDPTTYCTRGLRDCLACEGSLHAPALLAAVLGIAPPRPASRRTRPGRKRPRLRRAGADPAPRPGGGGRAAPARHSARGHLVVR